MKSTPLFPLLLAGLFAFAPGTSNAQAKFGVFDAQKITQDTAAGAQIQARLNSLKEKKSAELKKIQEDIEKLQQEFVQTATSASEDKKKDLGLRIQRKQDELDGAQKAANRELQLEVEAAQDAWQRRVIEIVNGYGKEKGYTLIVPAEVAVYYNPEIDVTADLIKIIDSQPAPKPAAPAPAAPAPAPPAKPPVRK